MALYDRYDPHGYRRAAPGSGVRTAIFLALAALAFVCLGVGLYHATRPPAPSSPGTPSGSDDRDMTRLLELRAAHGDALNEFRRADPDSRQGRAAATKVRRLAAEHNTLLAAHPTWTLSPLDTMGLVVPPRSHPWP